MKATELLVKQHRDVEALLDRLHGAGQGDERAIRQELAAALVAHAAIEQEIFYPAVREAMPEDILEALEEHGLVDVELARLLAAKIGDAAFEAKASVLATLVRAHIGKEEAEVFKGAERELGDEMLAALGERMAHRHRQLMDTGYAKVLQRAIEETVPRAAAVRAPAKKTTRRTSRTRTAAPAKKKAAPAKRGTTRRSPARTTPKRGTTAPRKGRKPARSSRASASRRRA